MLGLGKQGKTMFFRDLHEHLRHSRDQFVIAPGVPGMVMLVFTLPSYPYVFKILRDVFAPTKEVDHDTVKAKYLMVKQVDRVGRMADTLDFADVAFPKNRFSDALLEELHKHAPSLLEEDGDDLVIKHLYIERRMTPLNIYLDTATPAGSTTRYSSMAMPFANWPARHLPWRHVVEEFRHGPSYKRVVFYDYDEIEYMTDCNFRRYFGSSLSGNGNVRRTLVFGGKKTMSFRRNLPLSCSGRPKCALLSSNTIAIFLMKSSGNSPGQRSVRVTLSRFSPT